MQTAASVASPMEVICTVQFVNTVMIDDQENGDSVTVESNLDLKLNFFPGRQPHPAAAAEGRQQRVGVALHRQVRGAARLGPRRPGQPRVPGHRLGTRGKAQDSSGRPFAFDRCQCRRVNIFGTGCWASIFLLVAVNVGAFMRLFCCLAALPRLK